MPSSPETPTPKGEKVFTQQNTDELKELVIRSSDGITKLIVTQQHVVVSSKHLGEVSGECSTPSEPTKANPVTAGGGGAFIGASVAGLFGFLIGAVVGLLLALWLNHKKEAKQ